MNQGERLDYLVEALCIDSVKYKDIRVLKQEKKKVLRSLMNIRMPKPIGKDILECKMHISRPV